MVGKKREDLIRVRVQNIKADNNGGAIDTLTTVVVGARWKMIHSEWVSGGRDDQKWDSNSNGNNSHPGCDFVGMKIDDQK